VLPVPSPPLAPTGRLVSAAGGGVGEWDDGDLEVIYAMIYIMSRKKAGSKPWSPSYHVPRTWTWERSDSDFTYRCIQQRPGTFVLNATYALVSEDETALHHPRPFPVHCPEASTATGHREGIRSSSDCP
jgi:hypothetical protein